MQTFRRLLPPALALLFLFVPLVSHNPYFIRSVLAAACVYVILLAGLDLVVGYSGDVSVGHAGLFAVGAYTSAILGHTGTWSEGGPAGHWPWLLTVPVAIALTALSGLGLGVPALRLSGPYLAVATIAFGLIVQTVINESVWLTRGSLGITDVPTLRYGSVSFEGNNFYYLTYVAMLGALLVKHRLVSSYWGRAFEALRENSLAAECSGISRYRFKLSAFVLSAALAGLAGALFIHVNKYCGPLTFSLPLSILFLIMLIFGGTRSVAGNILGALVAVYLPDVLVHAPELHLGRGWNIQLVDYQQMFFGALLLFTLYFLPGGVVGLFRAGARRLLPAGLRPGLPGDTASGRGVPASAETARRNAVALGLQALRLRERPQPALPAAAAPVGTVTDHNAAPLLTTESLTIRFGGLVAVNELALDVRPGEVHALIGPNGSGKSTTVNLLSGVYRPTSGRILFAGQPTAGLTPHRLSRAGLARTFQNVALFGDMTVRDNVLVGLHHTFAKVGLLGVLLATPGARREERAAWARAQLLLDFVGLGDLAGERARNLPYGKQRLLEIARALAQDPSLILLDEPAAGLTSGEIGAVDAIIRRMKAAGLSILLIEHHMDLVMNVSDRVSVLDFGQKIAAGLPAAIQRDERVISAYLGAPAEELPAATTVV